MLTRLLKTDADWALTFVRIALGFIMLPHGAQKLLGWYGGPGFTPFMQALTKGAHVPVVFAFLAIMAESFGALGVFLGCLTRIAAFGLAVDMIVGAWMINVPNGLFMNWTGQQKGEGFEFHILVVGIALALMLRGAGALSVDLAIYRRLRPGTSVTAQRVRA